MLINLDRYRHIHSKITEFLRFRVDKGDSAKDAREIDALEYLKRKLSHSAIGREADGMLRRKSLEVQAIEDEDYFNREKEMRLVGFAPKRKSTRR
jgi:hypothetical protein